MSDDPLKSLAEVAYIAQGKKAKGPSEEVEPNNAQKYFRFLGVSRDTFYFMTVRGRQVLSFKAQKLTTKSILYMLAPLAWWEASFPGQNGFSGQSVDMAANWLINASFRRGVFTMDRLRGRGCWWDDGRQVVHAGNKLIVDGEDVTDMRLESTYVYEQLSPLPSDFTVQADDAESVKLLQLCNSLGWDNQIYGLFMAGWIVSAMVGGALKWRPHVFLSGPSGCGKSWVARHVVQMVMGDYLLAAKGETTEAGLRQTLQHDALPVAFDEAEGEDERTAAQMDRILALMRQSSADVGGKIIKGGADGNAQSFSIQSSFLLIAIRVPMQQTADENRISVLTLKRNNEEDKARFAEEIAPMAAELEESGFAKRFRARVLMNIDTIRRNADMFTRALTVKFNNRIGDQYGTLLGAAWFVGTTQPIDYDTAVRKAEALSGHFVEIKTLQLESDEDKLIAALSAQHIEVSNDHRRFKRTIGELIEICRGQLEDDLYRCQANSVLGRYGIKCGDDNEKVFIANRHEGLRSLLKNTPWGVGWNHILKRIRGAASCPNPKRFAGTLSRAVEVPAEVFGNHGHFDDD